MPVQRFPTTFALATVALIFGVVGIANETEVTPLFTGLVIIQALSLIGSPRYPFASITTYIAAFIGTLLAGHSTGLEIFLGIFLITALIATDRQLLAAVIATTITLGGFYSPIKGHIHFDLIALFIFLTIILLAYLLGFWINRNHKQRHHDQLLRKSRIQELTSLLHDTIASDLTSLIVQLETLALTTPQRHKELKKAAHTARNTLDRIRQLLTALNTQPNTRPTASFPNTLESFIQRLRDHGFTVTTSAELDTPVTMTLHNTALQRVLSEASTNIIKHATPQSTVTIDAITNDQGIALSITNHHAPTKNSTSDSTGLGLANMLHVLSAVGGTLRTFSDDHQWGITAHIPFH